MSKIENILNATFKLNSVMYNLFCFSIRKESNTLGYINLNISFDLAAELGPKNSLT